MGNTREVEELSTAERVLQEGIIDQCRNAGMNDYLSKPFTHESLIEIVTKWASQRDTEEPGQQTVNTTVAN